MQRLIQRVSEKSWNYWLRGKLENRVIAHIKKYGEESDDLANKLIQCGDAGHLSDLSSILNSEGQLRNFQTNFADSLATFELAKSAGALGALEFMQRRRGMPGIESFKSLLALFGAKFIGNQLAEKMDPECESLLVQVGAMQRDKGLPDHQKLKSILTLFGAKYEDETLLKGSLSIENGRLCRFLMGDMAGQGMPDMKKLKAFLDTQGAEIQDGLVVVLNRQPAKNEETKKEEKPEEEKKETKNNKTKEQKEVAQSQKERPPIQKTSGVGYRYFATSMAKHYRTLQEGKNNRDSDLAQIIGLHPKYLALKKQHGLDKNALVEATDKLTTGENGVARKIQILQPGDYPENRDFHTLIPGSDIVAVKHTHNKKKPNGVHKAYSYPEITKKLDELIPLSEMSINAKNAMINGLRAIRKARFIDASRIFKEDAKLELKQAQAMASFGVISLAEKARANKGGHGHKSIRNAFGSGLVKAASFFKAFLGDGQSQPAVSFVGQGGAKRFKQEGASSREGSPYVSSD